MKKVWYKYPEGYYENYVPWYSIARRLSVAPFLYTLTALLFVVIVMGYGVKEANDFIKRGF